MISQSIVLCKDIFFALTVISWKLSTNVYVADTTSSSLASVDDPVKDHVKCVGAVVLVLSTERKNALVAFLGIKSLVICYFDVIVDNKNSDNSDSLLTLGAKRPFSHVDLIQWRGFDLNSKIVR